MTHPLRQDDHHSSAGACAGGCGPECAAGQLHPLCCGHHPAQAEGGEPQEGGLVPTPA